MDLFLILVHTTMNNMTSASSSTEKKLEAFAGTVGDFIRYWGFRRIHGQIWTLVYLSNKPLSGVSITRTLRVSKALVSPALSQLLKPKLILSAGGDLKTKLYTANPDVISIIADVLANRESKILKDAQKKFDELKSASQTANSDINFARMDQIGTMISTARTGLDLVLQNLAQFKNGYL